MTKYIEGWQQRWKMECREWKGYRQCRGMYLGIREGEGGAEVQRVCRVGWKVEDAGGLSESDGWVVEVWKTEVGRQRAETEVWKAEAEVWKMEAEVWKAEVKRQGLECPNRTLNIQHT